MRPRRSILPRLLCVAAALAVLAPAEASAQVAARPDLSRAASAILVDARDGTVLLAKDPRERRAIASTTKLMTALLALERAKPGDVFRGTDYRALAVESKINLRPGERMQVQDLLEGLLLESANDAAVALAGGISGSREGFVEEMNRRAARLGLTGTSYANPIGLDAPGNHSTARDLAELARRLLRNPRFAAIVRRPQARLESGARQRVVRNRNDLVRNGQRPVDGVKTGHTLSAGYVLVGSATAPNGARVVSVVLGEPSEAARDADSLALLRWGVGQYRRVPVLETTRAEARAAVKYRDESVGLVPARALNLTLRRGERVRRQVEAPDELEGPIPAGKRVGTVAVVDRGRVLRRVPLVTAGDVRGASLPRRVWQAVGVPLTLLSLVAILVVAAAARRRRRNPAATVQ